MRGRIFARALSAVFAASLLVGVAWPGSGDEPSPAERRTPAAAAILAPGPGVLRTAMVDRGEFLREWATGRDKRVPPGPLSVAAILAGSVSWALLRARELTSGGRSRRSLRGIARPLGARSPPLRLA